MNVTRKDENGGFEFDRDKEEVQGSAWGEGKNDVCYFHCAQ